MEAGPARWDAGRQIVLRELWNGSVWGAKPMTVLADTDESLILLMAEGTWFKQPRDSNGRRVALPIDEWHLSDAQWIGGTAMYVIPARRNWSVILSWEGADRILEEWYINLQRTVRRSDDGIDCTDDVLDIVANPDLMQWAWKDERDFEYAQHAGLISGADARDIRAAGNDAVQCMSERFFPFDRDWKHQLPPVQGTVPRLPARWDIVDHNETNI
jgi:predicted RNA-binding protein associated with RNAse of E/G family